MGWKLRLTIRESMVGAIVAAQALAVSFKMLVMIASEVLGTLLPDAINWTAVHRFHSEMPPLYSPGWSMVRVLVPGYSLVFVVSAVLGYLMLRWLYGDEIKRAT